MAKSVLACPRFVDPFKEFKKYLFMISHPPPNNGTFLHILTTAIIRTARTQTHEIQTTDTLDKTHKEVFARDADE